MSAPSKVQLIQWVKIRPSERLAITLEVNFAFMEVTK